MAKPGSMYPQVEPGAAALMDRRILAGRPGTAAGRALAMLDRAQAAALIVGSNAALRRSDLIRAVGWGLGDLSVGDLAWVGLPSVQTSASETKVRRLLIEGAPMVVVTEGRPPAGLSVGLPVGLIDGRTVDLAYPCLSIQHRLERLAGGKNEALLWLLRTAGKVGEAMGTPVFAVGGFLRDLLLDRPALDVDLTVEGDGVALARRLAEEVRAPLVIHAGFGAAVIEGAATADGTVLRRVDVATARRERYELPGALPTVTSALLREDLRRRDFSINALAMALAPSDFGRLVDPLGGQKDLRQRRLRPLHPLSFVEDPTRVFRAARYAARLGFGLDRQGSNALRLALRSAPYPALSGPRLRMEIALIAGEPAGWQAFGHLMRWRALTLLDRGYRVSQSGRARLRSARRLAAWLREAGVGLDPLELALVALLMDQPAAVVSRCLDRLAVTGEPRARLRAGTAAGPLGRRLDSGASLRPSAVAEALRGCSTPAIIGAWLRGGRQARRRIEWFLREGRAVRPLLSGEDVVALGVPRGPQISRCLAMLRDRRLDGAASTLADERELVKRWLGGMARPADPQGPRRRRVPRGGAR